jgi:hypothetical protein
VLIGVAGGGVVVIFGRGRKGVGGAGRLVLLVVGALLFFSHVRSSRRSMADIVAR